LPSPLIISPVTDQRAANGGVTVRRNCPPSCPALCVRKIRCSISGVPARNRASFIRFWAIFVFAGPFAAQLIPLQHHPSKMRPPKLFRTLDSFCPTTPATLKPKTQNHEPANLPFFPQARSPNQPQLS
jgi:hypothetical protein